MKTKAKGVSTPRLMSDQIQHNLERRDGIRFRFHDRFTRLMGLQNLGAPSVIICQEVKMLCEAYNDLLMMNAQDTLLNEIFNGDKRRKK